MAHTTPAALGVYTPRRPRASPLLRLVSDHPHGLQTHGSRANWHPHLHLLVTEVFRRAVLRLFVRLELFDADQAIGMLTGPHSGFHVHTAVWVSEDDQASATRLAPTEATEATRRWAALLQQLFEVDPAVDATVPD